MLTKYFIQPIFLVLVIAILLMSPSYAGSAPEIPAGFGPLVLSGIIFSSVAIKAYFDTRNK